MRVVSRLLKCTSPVLVAMKVDFEPGLSAEHVYRTGSSIRVDNYTGLTGEVAKQMRASGYESTVAVPMDATVPDFVAERLIDAEFVVM